MRKKAPFRLWLDALRIIPRVEREEWEELDFLSKWLISTRAVVLIMTFLSSAIGGILAFRDGNFNLYLWLLCCFGLILAHATNNLLNDLVDYLMGVDRDNYFRAQYGPHPLEHRLGTIYDQLLYVAITGLLALSTGVVLVLLRGPLALYLLLVGAFFLLFYTFPLKYIGVGELSVLIVWGPLMVGGSYFIASGRWSWDAVIASLPYALGVTGVLLGKHIDKYEFDKQKGIRTLPVVLGERRARHLTILGWICQYLLTFYLISRSYFSPLLFIVLFSLPAFFKVYRIFSEPKPKEMPPDYRADVWPLWFVAGAFWFNRIFGSLYFAGLLIDAFLHRFLSI